VSTSLYSGASGIALGVGLDGDIQGLWGGATGLMSGFAGSSPYSGSSLYLDFLTPSLDTRITFTRGSNATLVDSTGKIVYAPVNLLLQSQTFDNAAWTKSGSSIVTGAAANPVDGALNAQKLMENTSTGQHRVFNTIGIAYNASTTFCFSVYVKAAERSFVYIRLNNGGGDFVTCFVNLITGAITTVTGAGSVAATNVGNGWWRIAAIGTSATSTAVSGYVATATSGSVVSYTGDGTSGIFIWGAQLEPLTYQTTPSTYVATTSAAYYGPRFDYDPVTLAPKGLLIEEQRTNLLLYSEQFDNAAWTNSGATVTANSIAAPSGEISADTIARTTSTADAIYNTIAFTGDGVKTVSIWIKKGTSPSPLIALLDATASTYRLWADVTWSGTTPSLAFTNGSLISSTNYGNGWWRLELATTAVTAANANRLYIYAGRTGSVNGDTVYCWGAQAENATFATSYIPTVASQVTRSADVATMTGTNFSSWYNQPQGTFVASYTATADTTFRSFFEASDAARNNFVRIRAQNPTPTTALVLGEVVSGGVTQATMQPATVAIGNLTSAVTYAVNNFATALNGGTVVSDTSGSLPVGVDRLVLTGGSFFNGQTWLRSIVYYNTRLADFQLQALTA